MQVILKGEQEVLGLLKHDIWQSGRELVIRGASFGTVYVYLTRLEEKGFVVRRERRDAVYEGQYEFRLTEAGIRARCSQEDEHTGLLPLLGTA